MECSRPTPAGRGGGPSERVTKHGRFLRTRAIEFGTVTDVTPMRLAGTQWRPATARYERRQHRAMTKIEVIDDFDEIRLPPYKLHGEPLRAPPDRRSLRARAVLHRKGGAIEPSASPNG